MTTAWIRDNGELRPISEEEIAALGVQLQIASPIEGFVYPNNSFIRLPLETGPYVIGNGVLPQQAKMVVYGAKKVKKSFLALQIARAVSEGEPLFGIPTRQTMVLYLQFEIALAELQRRMGGKQGYWYLGSTFKFKLDAGMYIESLRKMLDRVKPGLLILDPFYKILSGDVNDAGDVQYILDMLDDVVVGEHQCAVIIIHHENRMGGLRGSGRLFEWPDTVARISGGKDDRCTLAFEDMRNAVEVEDIKLVFNDENLEFEMAELPVSQQVYNLLDAGATMEELEGAELGVTRETLQRYVRRWRKKSGQPEKGV